MEVSKEETGALVTAMRDRVKKLVLEYGVILEIEKLTKYDGQGRCREWWGVT